MLEDCLAILTVPLRQHKHVLQRPLSHHVVRVGNEDHQDLHGRLEHDLVVVINHQGLVQGTWCSVEDPLEARSVQVLKFVCEVVSLAGR